MAAKRSRSWPSFQLAGDARLQRARRDRAAEPRAPGGARRPSEHRRRRDGFGLTDCRMTPARSARRNALLPSLPRAREGLLFEGLLRREDGQLPEKPAGRGAPGLSARREDLRNARASARGRRDRRARARRDRQPDVPRNRPPHLQRLHEGLHLSEAGAGQHSADRDRRPDRRARACPGASRSTVS